MDTILLYFLTDKDMGNEVVLQPRIPETAPGLEDRVTKRICCSPSITGCINSTEAAFRLTDENVSGKDFWLYSANVPVDIVYQPNISQVADTWQHGEFWVTEECKFFLFGKYRLSKQYDFPHSSLSRYQFVGCDDDCMVVDRVNAKCVYGDIDAFSFVEMYMDRDRISEANKYFEENRIIP